MPSLMPTGKQQFTNNAGVPLAGGKIYTYNAGTTTPKATYQDASATVQNQNPVLLNARGEALIFWDGAYDVKVTDANDILVYTVANYQSPLMPGDLSSQTGTSLISGTWFGNVKAKVSDLATQVGASLIGFIQNGAGTVIRSLQDKIRETPSLNDFAGATDDQRFANAKANGTKWLRIPSGVHAISGWTIAETDTLANLVFDPGAQLLVTAATNAIGLDIQKATFNISGTADVKSTGSRTDGFNTIGIRCGNPAIVGKAYIRIEATRTEGFSKRGTVFYQPVYVGIERAVSIGDFYGISVEPALGIGGSTVYIGPSYITGSKRGINLESASWVTVHEPVVEYCGDATTTDGALHFQSCGNVTVVDRYGEQNARNMVKIDSSVTFINGSMLAATASDVVSYVGAADADRGTSQLNSKALKIRRISYDDIDNQPLVIGSNLTVPVAGGSVMFGAQTMEKAFGTATNATWTAIKTIPATEMTGAPQQKAMYEYVVYAGYADQPTGFDAGTIYNGVLRSYSGVTPTWLRLNGNVIEVNITSASYGLSYNIITRRMFPGLQAI